MTTFENIIGADQLVQELTLPLAEIELNIQELETHKAELESKLDAGGKKFSLDFLKLNKSTQGDLDLVNRAIKEAYNERERIIKNNYAKAYKEASTIMGNHANKVRKEKAGDNTSMIQKIHEIREIFKGMEQTEKETASELTAFLKEIEPFVSAEPVVANTFSSPLSNLQGYTDTYSPLGQLKFVDVFRESDYGITGLIQKDFKPKDYEKESDERYGVVKPTPVEA